MRSKLDLDAGLISECRAAAAEITADVSETIAPKTSVAVERTVARLRADIAEARREAGAARAVMVCTLSTETWQAPGPATLDRAIKFIETYCRPPKGKGFGQPLRLGTFQKEWLEEALADGVERFLKAEVFPRHEKDHRLLSDPRRTYAEDGRYAPELSSTAPLTQSDFHRYEDYGVLTFIGRE